MSTATSGKTKETSKAVANRPALDEMVPEEMPVSVFDTDALRSVTSFDEAMKLAADAHGEVVDATEELGDGFEMVDKESIEGLSLIILEWSFRKGEFGKFAFVRAMAKQRNGQPWKVAFVDGGTGIAEQLAQYTKRTGKLGGLIVPAGIYASEYDNEHGHGTTWYLDVNRKNRK